MNKQKSTKATASRGNFSGRFGYVMAVAGSAVGLGNIWRFPSLAAKNGGGIFVLVYLLLAVTVGYTLMVSETAMGRLTGKGPVGAFSKFGKKLPFKASGWFNAIIPMLIAPYYCVIGGWVTKYLFEYCKGNVHPLAQSDYFDSFIANPVSVEFWFIIFTLAAFFIVLAGVDKGVERVSKIMMPLLLVLAIVVAIYSMSRPGALEGVKYFLVPDFKNFSLMTVVSAMGQMFYSLSIGMGILYTYGSYLKKDVDIEKSTYQVVIFDTAVAVLAGLMIIPAVFAFSGGDPNALNAGPALMFVTIPKVFESMGFGAVGGILFFTLVLFAALTSAMSLFETSVSTFSDQLGWNRKKCSIIVAVFFILLGTASALGFSVLDFIKIAGMTILDFFDFLTNSVMMPIAAFTTCVLIVRVVHLKSVADEVKLSSKFRLEKMYTALVKYVVPICLLIILISSIANVFGWIEM